MLGSLLKDLGYFNIDALDCSNEMLKKAKDKEIYKRFLVRFVDEQKFEGINDCEYDAIVCCGAISASQIQPQAFDEILRWLKKDGCKTMEFPESYFFNGKALVGFVLKTIQVADESQCRAQCYMTKNDHCLSYNYIPERLTCELSQSDHRVHPDNLVARQGSLYKASKVCSLFL
ncbi:hypothetical protein AC249_AIPGENE15168 [Exaiptasia diaphana]|nr:hypothetical protein AC249_AIPGENE15168 [Exaiptasia diaphana]